MLVLRTKDPALAELDNKIADKLRQHRQALAKAETDPSFLKFAETVYADMDALLELRKISAAKREKTQ